MQKTVLKFDGSDRLPDSLKGAVVIPGNFDGWHLGHQRLCQLARERTGLPTVILTFEPHPRQFFAPDHEHSGGFRLTSPTQKIQAIQMTEHVAAVVTEKFDTALSSMEADEFIDKILLNNLGAGHVVIGHDFHFGKGRGGNADTIKAKIPTTTIDAVKDGGGDIISSSHIRRLIGEGAVEQVPQYLGRPFTLAGVVEEGDKLGRTIDFPTANISLGDYCRPLMGVYASRVTVQGTEYGGVTNYGLRPTVDGTAERFETYIFDFDGDIYGEAIDVSLLKNLRPEMKFDGLEQLKQQISKDCQVAREFLKHH